MYLLIGVWYGQQTWTAQMPVPRRDAGEVRFYELDNEKERVNADGPEVVREKKIPYLICHPTHYTVYRGRMVDSDAF